MTSYGPASWLDYYDTHGIMGAWYYISCCIQYNCQMHSIARSQVCSELHSWLHSIVHSQPAWLTLPSKLSRHCQVHSQYAPKDTSKYVPKCTPGHALKDAPYCTPCHTPSLLDWTLSSKLSRHSDVHSEYASKYTSEYVLKHTPWHTPKDGLNCTRWHIPSVLHCVLPVRSQDALKHTPEYAFKYTPNLTWLHAPMYAPGRSMQRLAELQMPGTGRLVAGGIWWQKSWRRSILQSEP